MLDERGGGQLMIIKEVLIPFLARIGIAQNVPMMRAAILGPHSHNAIHHRIKRFLAMYKDMHES